VKPAPVLLMAWRLGIGGSERQCTAIASGLDRNLFEPHVGCFQEGFRADELRAQGVPVLRLPVTSFRNFSVVTGARRLGEYIREHQIRLVHTFDWPLNVYGVPVARMYRAPVVLSSQRAYRGLTPPVGRHLLRLTDRLVDGVVVNCQALRRHLIEDERVPARLVRLCYNGIDTETFRPCATPRPDGAGPAIGVVCALRPEKDLGTLLRAFAGVRKTYSGAKLLIVGGGPSLEGLQAQSRELGLGQSCRFEPANSDVVPWMHAIDIFVLPSLSEALSNSIMEAMACGCCVVASDVGGAPEIVIPHKTGLLFRKGDARDLEAKLLELIEKPALRRRMAAESARRMAERFSLASAAERMGGIYRSFLEAP